MTNCRYLRKERLTHLNIGGVGDLSANKMVTQLFYALDDCEKDQKLYDIFAGFNCVSRLRLSLLKTNSYILTN